MKRLLLVHNNALFREALALLLEWQMGLHSVHAGSVAEAHRILGEPHHEVCLAIVGIDLPNGDDAIELIEELRELEPNCPVLALATARSLQRCTRALQAGAEEVLTVGEPIGEPIEELTGAVRRLAASAPSREQGLGRLASDLVSGPPRRVDSRLRPEDAEERIKEASTFIAFTYPSKRSAGEVSRARVSLPSVPGCRLGRRRF
ncbi:MAG: response regulator [Actinomycetota bacterium]|nr:response regulator [Actinomycetota bacterium]